MVTAPVGSVALPSAVDDADVYAWAHNETSTGALAPVERVAGAGPDALVLIDGTSAAGGIAVDISRADAYYFAPQKSLGSDGGLWLALLSPAALERADKIAGSGRWIPEILSLRTAIDNSRKNQTLNTPAIATLFMLDNQLQWLNEQGGLKFAVSRTDDSASRVYPWAEARIRTRRPLFRIRPSAHPWWRPSTSRAWTPQPLRRFCAPTGSSTPSRTASSVATSYELGCSQTSSRRTSPSCAGALTG